MAKDLAKQAKRTPQWISAIERGSNDCTQKLQRSIADILCCSVSDLLVKPSESRLREIKRAYHLKQAGEPAKGVA